MLFKRVSLGNGFTLAELLIALAILGVIAVFTIPKILVAQTNTKYNAIAKEAAGTLSQAYQMYKLEKQITANTQVQDILASLNYVRLDTSASADMTPLDGSATNACSPTNKCYRLHNGALIWTYEIWFGGTTNLNAVYMILDPDGQATGKKDSLALILYYDGAIRTWRDAKAATVTSDGTFGPDPDNEPAWFSWN